MEAFSVGAIRELRYLRFDPDDMLLEELERYARSAGLRDGVVISGVGSLCRCRIHIVEGDGSHPTPNRFIELAGAIEIVSISGIIADHEPHLHISLVHRNVAVGGHLEPGCRILTMAELAVAVISPTRLSRLRTPEITGYHYKNLREIGGARGGASPSENLIAE